MISTSQSGVLRAAEGEWEGPTGGSQDRFLVGGDDSDGRFSLVQHLVPAGVIGAPMHRHSREDEFSFIVEGRVGVIQDGVETILGPGDLIVKPRGRLHTFWNAGATRAVVLELISPGGLETLFRRLDAMPEVEPLDLEEMAAAYGCEVDFDSTMALMDRLELSFDTG